MLYNQMNIDEKIIIFYLGMLSLVYTTDSQSVLKHSKMEMNRIIVSPYVRKMMEKNEWILDKSILQKLETHQVFDKNVSIGIKRLFSEKFLKENIIKEISMPSFFNLQELWLTNNKIESIEMLSRANMPNLKEAWMQNNLISNLKPLRKNSISNIETMSLYGNKISESKFLNDLHAPKLNTLWLEYEYKEKVQGEDLRWLCKIQTNSLMSLCIGTNKRMAHKKLDNILIKKKFHGCLKIYRKDD